MISVRSPQHRGNILLIDDNQADLEMIHAAFHEEFPEIQLSMHHSGKEALSLLMHADEGPVRTAPDLILLDLNMPEMDGLSVLKKIKGDPALRHIPVIVLSTSNNDLDIYKSYDSQANCFLVKPLHFKELISLVRHVVHFWLHVARIPGIYGQTA